MSKQFTRRQFLGSSLLLGGSLGINHFTAVPGRAFAGRTPTSLDLTGAIQGVHDPVIIKEGDRYYVFCTGGTIQVRKSSNMLRWNMASRPLVFATVPDWIREIIPGQNDMWAPDISCYNDKFHLYYAVSYFGENRSLIGLVTNKTLDIESDEFEWIDEGLVIQSDTTNDYNCIDPNLIVDADGIPWLAFGSFWSGLKMRRLDFETGKLSDEDTTLYSLAQRTVNSGAVEAPFIIHRGDFYYLFASFDFCCQGVNSTYYVVVGRSETVTGPYVDRDGVEMLKGGGTQVTFPTERWRGPGHNAILQDNGVDYLVYHAYDAESQGVATLRIDPIVWDAAGWPSI